MAIGVDLRHQQRVAVRRGFGDRVRPIMVPAPGRFSTTTGLPNFSSSSLPSMRARKSVAAPGVNGTTKVIGFDGEFLRRREARHHNQ